MDNFDLVDSDPNCFWTILLLTRGATRKRDGPTDTQELMLSTSHFTTATQLTVAREMKESVSEFLYFYAPLFEFQEELKLCWVQYPGHLCQCLIHIHANMKSFSANVTWCAEVTIIALKSLWEKKNKNKNKA